MNKQLFRKLLKGQLHLYLSTIFAGLNIAIDHAFIRRISNEHFDLEIAASYIPIVFLLVTRVLGQVLLSSPKASRPVVSSIQTYLAFAFVAGLALCPLAPTFLSIMRVESISGAQPFYLLYVLLGELLGLNLMLKYIRVAQGRTEGLYVGDMLANVINILGNSMSLLLLSSPDKQLLGVGFSSLIALICACRFSLKGNEELINLVFSRKMWVETSVFLRNTKRVIGLEFLLILFSSASGFAITYILTKMYFDDVKTAFNISMGILFILERPFVCLRMVVAPLFHEEDQSKLRSSSVPLAVLWIIPSLLMLTTAPIVLGPIYKIEGTVLAMVCVFVATTLLQPWTLFGQVKLRAHRMSGKILLIETLCSDLTAVGLFLLISSRWQSPERLLVAVLAVNSLRVLIYQVIDRYEMT